MDDPHIDPHIERTTDQARAGATPGIVRWVLLISISLAVASLGLIAVIGMETRDRYPPPPGNFRRAALFRAILGAILIRRLAGRRAPRGGPAAPATSSP